MCTLVVRVLLLIVLQCLNVTQLDAQSSRSTDNSNCYNNPCTKGEFYNCTCLECPPGSFKDIAVHRDSNCTPHSNLSDIGCSLVRNGTKYQDNKWNCSSVESTTVTAPPVHDLNVNKSSQSGSLPSSLAHGAPWSLVIGLVTVIICGTAISIGASVLWCCRGRWTRRREEEAPTSITEPMIELGT